MAPRRKDAEDIQVSPGQQEHSQPEPSRRSSGRLSKKTPKVTTAAKEKALKLITKKTKEKKTAKKKAAKEADDDDYLSSAGPESEENDEDIAEARGRFPRPQEILFQEVDLAGLTHPVKKGRLNDVPVLTKSIAANTHDHSDSDIETPPVKSRKLAHVIVREELQHRAAVTPAFITTAQDEEARGSRDSHNDEDTRNAGEDSDADSNEAKDSEDDKSSQRQPRHRPASVISRNPISPNHRRHPRRTTAASNSHTSKSMTHKDVNMHGPPNTREPIAREHLDTPPPDIDSDDDDAWDLQEDEHGRKQHRSASTLQVAIDADSEDEARASARCAHGSNHQGRLDVHLDPYRTTSTSGLRNTADSASTSSSPDPPQPPLRKAAPSMESVHGQLTTTPLRVQAVTHMPSSSSDSEHSLPPPPTKNAPIKPDNNKRKRKHKGQSVVKDDSLALTSQSAAHADTTAALPTPGTKSSISQWPEPLQGPLKYATAMFFVEIAITDGFPEPSVEDLMALRSWRFGYKHTKLPKHLRELTPELSAWIIKHRSTYRGRIRNKAMDKVEASYKLNTLSSLELDAERVRLIEGGNFCYKNTYDQTGMFLRPILLDVLVDSFYYGKKAIGIVFADKFGDAMPLSAIALALTAIEYAIEHWGKTSKPDFSHDPWARRYNAQFARFEIIQSLSSSALGKLQRKLMTDAKARSGSSVTPAANTKPVLNAQAALAAIAEFDALE